jgi:hypothetical protein
MKPGGVVTIERKECGINIELLTPETKKRGRRVLEGAFIFERLQHPAPRSKYAPHVGKKQQARQLFNAVTT